MPLILPCAPGPPLWSWLSFVILAISLVILSEAKDLLVSFTSLHARLTPCLERVERFRMTAPRASLKMGVSV